MDPSPAQELHQADPAWRKNVLWLAAGAVLLGVLLLLAYQWGVQRMRRKAKLVVKEIFDIFTEAPGLMPDDWNSKPGLRAGPVERARIVTDYIAGMTDRFALQEHRRLTDPMVKA